MNRHVHGARARHSMLRRAAGALATLALGGCLIGTASPGDEGEDEPVGEIEQGLLCAAGSGSCSFLYTANLTSNATTNTRGHPVLLAPGEVITLGTCGVSGASGSGDTLLRLYSPSGIAVAASDDACGGLLSSLSYTVPSGAGGKYSIQAGCFGSGSCSGNVAFNVVNSAFSYTASGTASATTNTINQTVTLSPGEKISAGTCGVTGGSGSGDTYLRLYNPSGVQVAFNDDACGGLLSSLAYTVPAGAGGAYQIRSGCYASGSCSGAVAYRVTSCFDKQQNDAETGTDCGGACAACQNQCANGVREGSEECDSGDTGSETCASIGYVSGPLLCFGHCHFDTGLCNTCGDGVANHTPDDAPEPCDGKDFDGWTCQSLGYSGGTLGCTTNCQLITSGCTP